MPKSTEKFLSAEKTGKSPPRLSAKGKEIQLALVGNPNCGKTTLFNVLTGSNQYVGNWPGVTVAKKTGRVRVGGSELTDLPGIYSLSPYSMEETVARDFLLEENPDVIINIVDGTNLERNLYLTLQLLELHKPVVVAVNMADDLRAKGWKLSCDTLSNDLGVPVIPITARRGENVERLLSVATAADTGTETPVGSIYSSRTEEALREIRSVLEDGQRTATTHWGTEAIPIDFLAAKLLEGDAGIQKRLGLTSRQVEQIEQIAVRYVERAVREQGNPYADRETLLADERYRKIEQITAHCLKKCAGGATLSERIDRVATHRILAIPCFLAVLFGLFALTFGPVGKLLSNGVKILFTVGIRPALEGLLHSLTAPEWCHRLVLDAVLGGVSGVLVFLPQIALLFLGLTLLEDSGYMARAAFLMDRPLRKIGLSGKSFIPMLMGFGCTTPAIMAARTLENEKDRKMTMMLLPFMSCGARLPIYAMFAGVFFPEWQGLVVFSLYLLGVLVAVLVGVVLRKTLFRGEAAPFVMELPPYRAPLFQSVVQHVWEKCKGFLVKAGTVIFSMSVLVWVLQSFTPRFQWALEPAQSMLGCSAAWLAPVLEPLGFGCWQAAVALLSGLIAKESVVSSLTILYANGSTALLPAALQAAFTPASAAAFLVFCLLYMPCISAFATLRREMNSIPWAVGTAALSTGVAWVASLLTYRIGILLGGGQALTVSVLPIQTASLSTAGNPAVALLSGGLILVGLFLFVRSLRRAWHGGCCTGCAHCRMQDACTVRKKSLLTGKSTSMLP